MNPNMLRVLAFFYLTITTAQATFLPLIIGGIVAGKVVAKGAFLALTGAAISMQIHKHLDDFWKQQVGPDAHMPKSIQDCMKGTVGNQVGIDGKSLIRFESFVNPKGTADINIIINDKTNANTNGKVQEKSNIATVPNPSSTSSNNQTTNQQQQQGSTDQQSSTKGQTSTQQQQQGSTDQQSSTQGLGPPRSSASDMAKSYGAPLGNTGMSASTNTETTTTTSTTTTTTVETTITKVEKSVQSMFFTENDLSLGKKMDLEFEVTSNIASFLPHEVVDKVQFKTSNFNNILDAFNLSATSQEAVIMKQVLTYCEDDKPGDKCCNCLETMVEFTKSIVGKSTKAISAMVDKDRNLEYNVQGFRNIPTGDKAVLCHKVPFPCAFFYCQKLEKTTVFLATLGAVDGSTINVPAVCHQDTNTWDPTHWAFQQLNVKPGSCPICHFLLDDDVLWITKV